MVKVMKHRVATNAGESRHVERRSHRSTSAANGARFVHSAAIDVDGRHAHETGDLASVQMTEFRQLRQEGAARDFTDATNRLEELILHAPCFVGLDRGGELRVDLGDLPVEYVDDGVDGALDFKQASAMASIEFGGSEVEELPASRDQSVEFSAVFIGKIAYWRLDIVSEASQDASVDAVGFCKNAQGEGVVACLSRIDQGDRQFGLVKCDDEWDFIAAGGLDDDLGDVAFLEDMDKASDVLGIVAKGVEAGKGKVGEVE